MNKMAEEYSQCTKSTEQDVQAMANYIRRSKHFVVFTGAGISTAAGLPALRGTKGIQTLRQSGKEAEAAEKEAQLDTWDAYPTEAHMALALLVEGGYVKHVITQNYDGLHRMSGIPEDKISYLHGDQYTEECERCRKQYIRDFRVTSAISVDWDPSWGPSAPRPPVLADRHTGRPCDTCGGALVDTLVHYDDDLPKEPRLRAISHIKRADLCLVLGSSLMVDPGVSDCVRRLVEKKGTHLAICNLQHTHYHDFATKVKGYTTTDDFMYFLMEQLKLPHPVYKVGHTVRTSFVSVHDNEGKKLHKFLVESTKMTTRPPPFAWGDVSLGGSGAVVHAKTEESGTLAVTFPKPLVPGTVFRLSLQLHPPRSPSVELDITYTGDDGSSSSKDDGDGDIILFEWDPRPDEESQVPRPWVVQKLQQEQDQYESQQEEWERNGGQEV